MSIILEVNNLTALDEHGDYLIKDLSFSIRKGDKVIINFSTSNEDVPYKAWYRI